MTTFNIGRWLLVALAVFGLAFAAPVVSAHGDDTTADDAPPYGGTGSDWAAWMEAHMTDHMGPGAVEWMESHIDEMAHGDYGPRGYGGYGPGRGC